MRGKAKSRCRLGMLKVKKLSHNNIAYNNNKFYITFLFFTSKVNYK